MTDSDRITRDDPARGGPNRGATNDPAPTSANPSDSSGSKPPLPGASVSQSVADVVRLGYEVIGQNIHEGRIAADRFRAGDYNIRDVPYDLSQMSLRLLGLTRELSATTFDILDKLLRDPAIAGALQRRSTEPNVGSPSAGGDRKFYPPPGFYSPAVPPAQPGQPPSSDANEPGVDPNAVTLTCNFTGVKPAIAQVATLTRPKTPTTLTSAGLTSLDLSLPPIGDVTFSAAADGFGVIADIKVKDDQPAGIYSGVVCAADTKLPLGMLTVEVLP